MSEIIKAAKALIDSVTFDVSGVDGRGGNGGLTSTETIRKCDQLRLAIYRAERDWQGSKQ